MNDHTKSRSYRLLERYQAPEAVKAKLSSLLEANSWLPTDIRDTERDLLIEACREANFTRPFEGDGRKRSYRARLLPESHPDYRDDIGGNFVFLSRNSPGEEQAYRRGYDQGFSASLSMLRDGESVATVQNRADAINKWRTETIQIIGTLPGHQETIEVGLNFRRSGISLSLRYKVFERDKSRCRICGCSVEDGVTLEVDHIVPVSKGGSNDIENLQTLCFECNRGKSDK